MKSKNFNNKNHIHILASISLSLSLVGSVTANAESSCDPTPEISKLVGEVRNQKDVGWCFANSGADLLTAAYRSEIPEGEQVSGNYVALNYFQSEAKKNALENQKGIAFQYGGSTFRSISLISKPNEMGQFHKLCFQKVDNNMQERGLQTQSLQDKFITFKNIFDLYKKFERATNDQEISDLRKKLHEQERLLINKNSFLKDYDHDEIKAALKEKDLDSAIMKVIDIVCKDSSDSATRNSVTINSSRQFEHYYKAQLNDANKTSTVWDVVNKKSVPHFDFINRINQSLNQKKPISISYNVENVLTDMTSVTGPHASTIIDRKMKNGQCHYFVRNSWGKQCKEKKMVKEIVDNKISYIRKEVPIYKYECEEARGGFWIPEDALKKEVIEVIGEKLI